MEGGYLKMTPELRAAFVALQREVLSADLSLLPPDATEKQVDAVLASHLTASFPRAPVVEANGVDGSNRRADLALEFSEDPTAPPVVIGIEFKLHRSRHQGAGEMDRGLGQCIAYTDAYDAAALVVVYMSPTETEIPEDWASIDSPRWVEHGGGRVPIVVLRRSLDSGSRDSKHRGVASAQESAHIPVVPASLPEHAVGPPSHPRPSPFPGDGRTFLSIVADRLGLKTSARHYVIKNHAGVSIGIDDIDGGPRRVHAFTHSRAVRARVNRRLARVATLIAAGDVTARHPQLRKRLVTPSTQDGVMYVGWEWRKADSDAAEAAMAQELVRLLMAAWDES
jgi:hypothetical protein